MAASTRLVALLVALPFALGACGQTAKNSATDFQGDQRDVAQTVEDLQSFARKGDTAKICTELLAQNIVARIQSTSKSTCEKGLKDALADADAFELQVKKVTVAGDKPRPSSRPRAARRSGPRRCRWSASGAHGRSRRSARLRRSR
jgi:beta-phosphoglucomutase-like phosphatase (HAD superfamily)